MTKVAEISMSDLTKSVTVHVTLTGRTKFGIRVYIGKLFIRIGVYIIGMKYVINDDEVVDR